MWPTSVKWYGDVQPGVTTTARAVDVFSFTTIDGGSTWYGNKALENAKLGSGSLYQLWTWGAGGGTFFSDGQLGLSDAADRSSPVQVGTLTNWATVMVGSTFTAAIKTDGTLWTWGDSDRGKLGLNSTVDCSSPIQVGTLTNWTRIAAEGHVAAIKSDGTLWTWGDGSTGELGSNAVTSRSSPVQVGTLTNWSKVAAADAFTAAIKSDGTLWTWGTGADGLLGSNAIASRSSPVQVGAATNWASVVAESHVAAIRTDGTLWVWGQSSAGRLGLNTNVLDRSSPVQVGTLTNWATVMVGTAFTAATKTDGTLWTWGSALSNGATGHNDTITRSSPTQVGTLTDWASVFGRDGSPVSAIKTDGTLWMWGDNSDGSLGQSDIIARSSPTQVGTRTDWAYGHTGASHAAFLTFT